MNGSLAAFERIWREPLAQFLLFGAALFLLHALYGAAVPRETGSIEVPAPRLALIRQELQAQLQRAPSEAEVQSAIDRWLADELLFREAQALGLDRSDVIVRRRLVQKMESLIEAPAESEVPTDAQLQALLDADPQRYGLPVRYSFEQRLFARGERRDRLRADALAALEQLRAQGADAAGDAFFAGNRLRNQDAVAVRKVFGAGFAQALDALPVGRWEGPVASGYGLHLVRLDQRSAFVPATLASARRRLEADWTAARKQALLSERIAKIRQRYAVVVDHKAPPSPQVVSKTTLYDVLD
jgi:hypothetical protein